MPQSNHIFTVESPFVHYRLSTKRFIIDFNCNSKIPFRLPLKKFNCFTILVLKTYYKINLKVLHTFYIASKEKPLKKSGLLKIKLKRCLFSLPNKKYVIKRRSSTLTRGKSLFFSECYKVTRAKYIH